MSLKYIHVSNIQFSNDQGIIFLMNIGSQYRPLYNADILKRKKYMKLLVSSIEDKVLGLYVYYRGFIIYRTLLIK